MDENGVDGIFGTMAGPTAERWRLDTGLPAFAGTTADRKGSNFPAAAKPV